MIDEKPTGSRDPFALRRAALGVIRVLTANNINLPLFQLINRSARVLALPIGEEAQGEKALDLLDFFHDRLKVSLRDAGARHDLVDAVIVGQSDDMVTVTHRGEALSALLGSEDGKNLLAGYRRAANILAAEEKKDGRVYDGAFELSALTGTEEAALGRAVNGIAVDVALRVAANDYHGAIASLATLRGPVDAFFEAVLVNDPDPAVRANRLNLLAKLRDTMRLVADFSKVAG